MPNQSYVLDHIFRIENRHRNNPSAQLNSKWRIASNQDLFNDLDGAGTLTPVQASKMDKFIDEVKRTRGANIK
ncbi:hypothetical protein NDI44_27230 [Trichocoleus sp. DQ-A3]|uniref:hypothetical protein n=1 Tax=Cyanophyceae TaxID=3028117 RepID=UPI001682C726|nr:hypothetical protein [Coleofasciculus sp. FACHB-125]MBD1903880.1 hypothetical protein [Coleofasciculus sp. FACHB-125]